MANYNSLNVNQNIPGPGHGLGGDIQRFRFTLPITAALLINDTFVFGNVPAGFRLTGAMIKSDDLDSNGAPTITIDVGDSGDTDRIFAAATVAQTGTYSSAPANTGMDYKFLAETQITGLVKVAPATGVAAGGTIVLNLYGVIEGIIATP